MRKWAEIPLPARGGSPAHASVNETCAFGGGHVWVLFSHAHQIIRIHTFAPRDPGSGTQICPRDYNAYMTDTPPESLNATPENATDSPTRYKILVSAVQELRTTVECLHSDILNLATSQDKINARLKQLDFERNYWKQSSNFMKLQMKKASKFIPSGDSSLIPPPPMPTRDGPAPASAMRSPMRVLVSNNLVGLIIGRQYKVAKAICKQVRESPVARAWFSDVWCRLEVGENVNDQCEILIKAKYHGIATLVAERVLQRVRRAEELRRRITHTHAASPRLCDMCSPTAEVKDLNALCRFISEDGGATKTTTHSQPNTTTWTTIRKSTTAKSAKSLHAC